MTQVILPKTSNIDILTVEKISDIVNLLTGNPIYDTPTSEDRNTGQYIKVITDDGAVHYVCYSNFNSSRNTRTIQPFPPAYIAYFADPATHKDISVYIVAKDTTDRSESAKFLYKCFATINTRVLNYQQLFVEEQTPFKNYTEMKRMKVALSEYNEGNNPSYFTDDENQISLFAKVDGVNARESFILALVLDELAGQKVVVYPVYKQNTDNFTQSELNTLKLSGINIGERINTVSTADINVNLAQTDEVLRDTPKFHYNLLKKFGESKRCYLCGCDVEHLIIGSHIERVTDIKRSADYTDEEKKIRVVDGDNGLWLCANHDKMFEFGIIYFENSVMKIGAFITENLQKTFISNSIFDVRQLYFGGNSSTTFEIKPEHYNNNMKNYLSKHTTRVA